MTKAKLLAKLDALIAEGVEVLGTERPAPENLWPKVKLNETRAKSWGLLALQALRELPGDEFLKPAQAVVRSPFQVEFGRELHSTLQAAKRVVTEWLDETSPETPLVASTGRWKPTPWIFISSAQRELEPFRSSARDAILRAKMLPVAMESWTAASLPPDAAIRKRLAECNAVVLIGGHRYGSIERESGLAYTEIEYEEAKKSGQSVFVFLVSSLPGGLELTNVDPEDLARAQRFIARLQADGNLTARVDSSSKLETHVFQALTEWRQEEEQRS